MEPSIYRFILRYSKREQIVLLIMTGLSFPFLYYSLDLPKKIINEALGAKGAGGFPVEWLGLTFDQLEYLWTLSGLFLALVCINGGFKYVVNVYRGQLGERMLRRLRYDLYSRVLRFPLGRFRRMSQGEIIPMITAEVEPLGGFIGDSISLPAFQGGTLITILFFMFMQDPVLGLAAISLYPIQAYVIPKLQRQVNLLGKERVRTVRALSDKIGETVSGVQEVHANDGARLMLARFAERLGRIYDIRFDIYKKKFFIKFLNNFLAQLTPFFFYSIGGYLVIQGELSIGAMVAVLAAYKDLSAPWKELLGYYERKEDARIKYEQVIEQFDPPGVMDAAVQAGDAADGPAGPAGFRSSNLGLVDDDGETQLDGISLRIEPGERVALLGPTNGGKEALGLVLARLVLPTAGSLSFGDRDMAALPEAVTGRRIGYVGPAAFAFSTSIRENLLMGAMHRPLLEPERDEAARALVHKALSNAEISGNSVDDPGADWVDYDAIGVPDPSGLPGRLVELLDVVDLWDDCYLLGLRGTLDPEQRPDAAARILEARRGFAERLTGDPALVELVEPFAADRYNTNASVAENLLFGTPVDGTFSVDAIAANDYVRSTLGTVGLTEDFLTMGRDMAATMVELFADLPADHEFFAQFSFISPDDLPEFQSLVTRTDRGGLDSLPEEDRTRLLSLPFKLIQARHRLGLLDDTMQRRILEARRAFAENLPPELTSAVAFFSEDSYNAAASVQDNVLFGKIAYGQADAAERVGTVIAEVLAALDLRSTVIEVGLDFQVGIGGSRLSAAQRQKIGVARVLLRRPEVLVFSDAIAALDGGAQGRVIDRILAEAEGRTVVWALQNAELARRFDRVLVLRGGKVVEDGPPDKLDRAGTEFRAMAAGG
ncbi:ABC transporter ATP-binding protein [Thalassobaculum sp.]|uniref:ABC transporter ATP-binding protein n=1 Tax=Thalassobaculum sp. TaxID=2022740 RepID=UPI0032EEACE2